MKFSVKKRTGMFMNNGRLDMWIKSNTKSSDPYASSTPPGQPPNVKLFLMNVSPVPMHALLWGSGGLAGPQAMCVTLLAPRTQTTQRNCDSCGVCAWTGRPCEDTALDRPS